MTVHKNILLTKLRSSTFLATSLIVFTTTFAFAQEPDDIDALLATPAGQYKTSNSPFQSMDLDGPTDAAPALNSPYTATRREALQAVTLQKEIETDIEVLSTPQIPAESAQAETTAEDAVASSPFQSMQIEEAAAEPEPAPEVVEPEETAVAPVEPVAEPVASASPFQSMQIEEAAAEPEPAPEVVEQEETVVAPVEPAAEPVASASSPFQSMQIEEVAPKPEPTPEIVKPEETAVAPVEPVAEPVASASPFQSMQIEEVAPEPEPTPEIVKPEETAVAPVEPAAEPVASASPFQSMQIEEVAPEPTPVLTRDEPKEAASTSPFQSMEGEKAATEIVEAEETAVVPLAPVAEQAEAASPFQSMQIEEATSEPDPAPTAIEPTAIAPLAENTAPASVTPTAAQAVEAIITKKPDEFFYEFTVEGVEETAEEIAAADAEFTASIKSPEDEAALDSAFTSIIGAAPNSSTVDPQMDAQAEPAPAPTPTTAAIPAPATAQSAEPAGLETPRATFVPDAGSGNGRPFNPLDYGVATNEPAQPNAIQTALPNLYATPTPTDTRTGPRTGNAPQTSTDVIDMANVPPTPAIDPADDGFLNQPMDMPPAGSKTDNALPAQEPVIVFNPAYAPDPTIYGDQSPTRDDNQAADERVENWSNPDGSGTARRINDGLDAMREALGN